MTLMYMMDGQNLYEYPDASIVPEKDDVILISGMRYQVMTKGWDYDSETVVVILEYK